MTLTIATNRNTIKFGLCDDIEVAFYAYTEQEQLYATQKYRFTYSPLMTISVDLIHIFFRDILLSVFS